MREKPHPEAATHDAGAVNYSPLVKKRASRAMKALGLPADKEAPLYFLLCEHYRQWLDRMAHHGSSGGGAPGGPPPQGSEPSAKMDVPPGERGPLDGGRHQGFSASEMDASLRALLSEEQVDALYDYFKMEQDKMRPNKGGQRPPSGPPPGGGGPGGF